MTRTTFVCCQELLQAQLHLTECHFLKRLTFYQNVQDNNKIVWKNIEVYPLAPGGHRAPGDAIAGNLGDTKMKVKFQFTMLDADGNPGFLNKGKLEVTAVGKLKDILKDRVSGDGVKETGQGTFEVNKDGAALRKYLPGNEKTWEPSK